MRKLDGGRARTKVPRLRQRATRVAAAFCVITSTLAIVVSSTAEPASAFASTAHWGGPNHEKVTRAALECFNPEHKSDGTCFEQKSIDSLAGTGDFPIGGAVENPDVDHWGQFAIREPHCDGVDYVHTNSYPTRADDDYERDKTAAEDRNFRLLGCQLFLERDFAAAVDAAQHMFNKDGKLDPDETESDCNFVLQGSSDNTRQGAKCKVLLMFGRLLHGVEDFYSHSNWSDWSAEGTLGWGSKECTDSCSVDNPPALGLPGPSPLLRFKDGIPKVAPPPEFTTGCYPDEENCTGRVTHELLNKDAGSIVVDPASGEITGYCGECHPRDNNSDFPGTDFTRALRAARLEAKAQWQDLSDKFKEVYGKQEGNVIICALTHDEPKKCQYPTYFTVRFAACNYDLLGPFGNSLTGNQSCANVSNSFSEPGTIPASGNQQNLDDCSDSSKGPCKYRLDSSSPNAVGPTDASIRYSGLPNSCSFGNASMAGNIEIRRKGGGWGGFEVTGGLGPDGCSAGFLGQTTCYIALLQGDAVNRPPAIMKFAMGDDTTELPLYNLAYDVSAPTSFRCVRFGFAHIEWHYTPKFERDSNAAPLDANRSLRRATARSLVSGATLLAANAPLPAVTSVEPFQGTTAGGTFVVINGTNLADATEVDFGPSNPATDLFCEDSQCSVTTPPGSGTVDVTVTTPSGMSSITPADTYTYLPPPTVTSVSPASGVTTGGAQVVVTGTGLEFASEVDFGSGNPADLGSCSPTQCTVTAPAGSGTVDVIVTTPFGTSDGTPADQFSFVEPPPPPTVTAVSPASVDNVGGTEVTVTGTNLAQTSDIHFGLLSAADVPECSDTSCTVVAPSGSGTVDVTVTTPGGTSAVNAADQLTYNDPPPPTITDVTPATGPTTGGTAVTVTGTHLSTIFEIDFGSENPATELDCSDTSCTLVSPPASAGVVDVRALAAGSTSATSAADEFSYFVPPPPPTVTDVSPPTGSVVGGESLVVTGTNLADATSVRFGSIESTIAGCNATSCTVTSPHGAEGVVDITVQTTGGVSITSAADEYTYVLPLQPTIEDLSLHSGSVVGGDQVTITGAHLAGATEIDFGPSNPAFIVGCSDSACAVSAPPGAGPVDVSVTTPGGTSAPGGADVYTYVSPPVPAITGLSVLSGPSGTEVTVTGSNLLGARDISFGDAIAVLEDCTADTCVVLAPVGPTGTVHVTITTPGGVSPTTSADLFTYVTLPSPTIDSVMPAQGAPGDTVTVHGSNLGETHEIDFGTVVVRPVFGCTETDCTVTAPVGNGTVDVVARSVRGSSSTNANVLFTYTLGGPVLTGLAPNSGPATGGDNVAITGSGFTDATSVDFSGLEAPFVVVDDQHIDAVTPASSAGSAIVSVTTAAGRSAFGVPSLYSYVDGSVPPPTTTTSTTTTTTTTTSTTSTTTTTPTSIPSSTTTQPSTSTTSTTRPSTSTTSTTQPSTSTTSTSVPTAATSSSTTTAAPTTTTTTTAPQATSTTLKTAKACAHSPKGNGGGPKKCAEMQSASRTGATNHPAVLVGLTILLSAMLFVLRRMKAPLR